MDDLIAFYRAQLNEDQAEIEKHPDDPCDPDGFQATIETSYPCFPMLTIGKQRALRDIETKRRIVEEHASEDGHCSTCTIEDMEENAGADYDSEPEMIRVRRPVAWPCPTVRLLAELYTDRPGYKEEWRP